MLERFFFIYVIVTTRHTYGLPAHMQRFDSEQKCQSYLIRVRWNDTPTCPKCGNSHMNYYLKSRNCYKCSECYKQFSITSGTIFHGSKIPLTKWFLGIYFNTTMKRGVSSVQLAKLVEVQQRTAWFMLQRIREAMRDENEIILGGIVEADESFVSPKIGRDLRLQAAKRKHEAEQDAIHGPTEEKRFKMGGKKPRGRKKGETKEVLEQRRREGKNYKKENPRIPFERGAMILGMVERGGKIVLKKLGSNTKSVNKNNIYPHLHKHIASDSLFISDQLNLYNDTAYLFAEHQTVNHDIGYVVDGVHINNVENLWMHLKKMIFGTYFHLSYHHFDGYLNENVYRWNRRTESELALFDAFFPLVSGKKITYREIMKRKEKLAA